jgi:hypothetical protein
MDVECGEGTFILNCKVAKNAKKKSLLILCDFAVKKKTSRRFDLQTSTP